MKKQYQIIKLETKESYIPDGCHMTTRTEYFGVVEGYTPTFDTLEEAEEELARVSEKYKEYTILTIYKQEP